MKTNIKAALGDAAEALQKLMANDLVIGQIELAAVQIAQTLQADGRVFSCGNGGSMCDAMHFAEELSGKFRKERRPLAASSISDPAHISCTGNDFGYDAIFSRYAEAHVKKSDVLFGISTSGTSANIIAAAKSAKANGGQVIVLTGRPGSELSSYADIDICTEGFTAYSDRIQELHIKVIHILIELVERQLFPELY